MGGHHNHGQQIDAHQRWSTHQQRQTFQRAGVFAGQFWQQFDQTHQVISAPMPMAKEGGAPAEVLTHNAPDRQA